jgi:peptidoglycan/LPS O-acetylase OafA/YrhL
MAGNSAFLNTIKSKSERIAVLDGLRALAILLVLMRHSIRPFWTDLNQPFFKIGPIEFGNLFINGWMGVDLFFILSGFLITSHLQDRYLNQGENHFRLFHYAKRRFFRIAPVYYFVLTITVLGLFPFYPYPSDHDNLEIRYLYHLLFLQDYISDDINVVFWSLGVEIKYYLLVPFFLLFLSKQKSLAHKVFISITLFLTLFFLRFFTVLNIKDVISYESYFLNIRTPFHLCFDGLVIGTLCAILWSDQQVRLFLSQKKLANFLFFTGCFGFLYLSLMMGVLVDTKVNFFDMTLLPTLINVSFACMLLGLLGGSSISTLFAHALWHPVALISYSLYLFHLPLMYPAEILTRHFFILENYSPQIQWLLYIPFFIVLIGCIASLSYIWIERPFIRWAARSAILPRDKS